MGKIVNKQELAEILGKSETTLTTWQKNGMPIKFEAKRGQPNQYDTEAVIAWWLRRDISKLTVGGDGEVLDYEAERARLTHHQANKTEMEAAVMRGDLIPADTVQQVQADMVGRCRARLLAIPTKAAHQMLGLDDLSEAQDVLKQNIYEALRELADYRPEHYGITVVREDSSDMDATA